MKRTSSQRDSEENHTFVENKRVRIDEKEEEKVI